MIMLFKIFKVFLPVSNSSLISPPEEERPYSSTLKLLSDADELLEGIGKPGCTHGFSDLLRHQHEPLKIFVQLQAQHLVCGKAVMLPDKDLEAEHSRLRCSNTSSTATNSVFSGNMTL